MIISFDYITLGWLSCLYNNNFVFVLSIEMKFCGILTKVPVAHGKYRAVESNRSSYQ